MKYLILLLLIGCNNQIHKQAARPSVSSTTFNEIDYSYDNGNTEAYSMHIDIEGNCILGEGRIPKDIYIGQLSLTDLRSLDSLISKIPNGSHGLGFINDNEVNRPSYHFLLTKIKGDFYTGLVTGTGSPSYLGEIFKKLQKLKHELKVTKSDTIYTFISINPIPPPPPISKENEY